MVIGLPLLRWRGQNPATLDRNVCVCGICPLTVFRGVSESGFANGHKDGWGHCVFSFFLLLFFLGGGTEKHEIRSFIEDSKDGWFL